jgi:hypothetical protein
LLLLERSDQQVHQVPLMQQVMLQEKLMVMLQEKLQVKLLVQVVQQLLEGLQEYQQRSSH